MVAISIRNLSKRFGGHTVLDRVNLEIGQGEMFFLLGPSGCGKTTLLRHVAGLVQQDSGELFFDGQDVSSLPPHRRHTALMFQSYALWPHLNVAQNIAFGLEEQGMARVEIRKRVAAALERIQMGAYAERSIAQLSGGQQQRVALARALIVEPRCLLLDEPLSNLDTRLRQELRQEIRSLCKQSGVTAIYVTHDQDEALSMADRLAVMDQGCIIQTGPPQEIYNRPATAMVAAFLGDANFLPGTVRECTGNRCLIQTCLGPLESTVPTGIVRPAVGTHVELCLRPEALFFDPAPEVPNQFTAKLEAPVFLGAAAQYRLNVDGVTPLHLRESHPRQLRPAGTQAGVRIGIDPEDVVILPGRLSGLA